MRYAIFSDIHNHTVALSAVLRHADEQRVDRFFCLGDVGLDACVDLVRQMGAPTVFGNWEVSGWRYLATANQRWVLDLPPLHREAQFWLTHAAPLWPENITNLADLHTNRHQVPMANLFPYLHHESEALWETLTTLVEAKISLLFHGHTHRQLAWRFTADNQLQKLPQRTLALQPGETLVVGVGSVGRPLDGAKPSYVIYDDTAQQVEMVRVP